MLKRLIRYKVMIIAIALGCLLAGGLAGASFQPSSAAQDDSTRINPKVVHPSPDSISGNSTSQEDLAPALHPLADIQSEQFSATSNSVGFVIESDGERTICRDATEEEARAIRRRDPEQQLRAINDEGASALTPSQSPSQSVDGLKIILRGTQQLEQFPAAKAAFIRAAQRWEAVIQSPITMVIDVDFGPTRFGEPFPVNVLGSADEQEIGNPTGYPAIRSALIGRASNAQEAALYNALPQSQLPTDLGATTGVFGPSAILRALGIINPVADPDGDRERFGPPPSIGFNSGFQFDFDPSNGIEPDKTDFDATATHEIGHALGFTTNAGLKEQAPSLSVRSTPWDLFRFRPGITTAAFSTAQRVLSSGGEQVFFGGGPELALSTGRPNGSGGDGKQGSHWKDDGITGRYIGIMDPTIPRGARKEITENDLKALDLMGYYLKPNANPNPTPTPPPNQQTMELKLDDGSLETGAIANGLIVVNRLTPPGYPATLTKLRFIFAAFQNQPDPTGKPISLLIFTDPSGAGQPPSGAQITRINTTVPGTSLNNFFEMGIPNGPTINSGDFYIGFQAPSPHQGVGFFLDTSGQSPNQCFYSSNDGAGFSPLAPALQLNSANALIRAIVSVGGVTPTPTPTPPPGGNTVALTSGSPQTGSIAAPAQGSGEISATQYTIQVPVGATRLKVDLNGNPDVDLYLRFSSRIQLQGAEVVADIKSESPTGAESLTITPGGSPALQGGLYYIAVGNYGPGAANFTVTATVTGGAGNCSFVISPTNRNISASGALGAVNVTTSASCNWTATSNANFINLLPPASGNGSGSITYSVGTNTGPNSRTGTLTVAGQTFTLKQDGAGNPAPGNVVSVSAANYDGSALASEAIVAAFGARLATTVLVAGSPECRLCLSTELGGTRVMVKDSAGDQRLALLFFVSPNQVNYLMPQGTAVGTATVTVTSGDGAVSVGTAQIATVAPGLFTANGDGRGAPAAIALRVKPGADQSIEEVARYDSAQRRFVPRPLDLGPVTHDVFLVLFGTGLRHRQALSTVSLMIGGVPVPLYYVGAQGQLAGMDQINALLPRSLIGRGEVDVALVVDGKPATTVRINVQ